ncbi:MAG: hypothetical protein H0U73_07235 [Tatlockia sp.]|nr:hypothetical protein [Tatlockia sp.]
MQNKIDENLEFTIIKTEISQLPQDLRATDVENTIKEILFYINSKNEINPQSATLRSVNLLRKKLYNQLLTHMVSNLGEKTDESLSFTSIISSYWQTPTDLFSANLNNLSKNELLSLLDEASKILTTYRNGEIPTKFVKFMTEIIPAYNLEKIAMEKNNQDQILNETYKIYASYIDDIEKLTQQVKEKYQAYRGKNTDIKKLIADLEDIEEYKNNINGVLEDLNEVQVNDINQALMDLEPLIKSLKIKSKKLEILLSAEPQKNFKSSEKKRPKNATINSDITIKSKSKKKSKKTEAILSEVEGSELKKISHELESIVAYINLSHPKLRDNRQIINELETLDKLVSPEKMTISRFNSIKKLNKNFYALLLKTMISDLGGTIEGEDFLTSLGDGFSNQFFTAQPLEELSNRKLVAKINKTLRTLNKGDLNDEVTAGLMQKIISAYGQSMHIQEPVNNTWKASEPENNNITSSDSFESTSSGSFESTSSGSFESPVKINNSPKSKKGTVKTRSVEFDIIKKETIREDETPEAKKLKEERYQFKLKTSYDLKIKELENTIEGLPLISPLVLSESLSSLNKDIDQLLLTKEKILVKQQSSPGYSEYTIDLLSRTHQQLDDRIKRLKDTLSKNVDNREQGILNSIGAIKQKASGIQKNLQNQGNHLGFSSEELVELTSEISTVEEKFEKEISDSPMLEINNKLTIAIESLNKIQEKIKVKERAREAVVNEAQNDIGKKVIEIIQLANDLNDNEAYSELVDLEVLSKEISIKEKNAKDELSKSPMLEIAKKKSDKMQELDTLIETIKAGIRVKNKTFFTEISILRQRLTHLNEKKSRELLQVDQFVIADWFEVEIARLEKLNLKPEETHELYNVNVDQIDKLNTAIAEVEQDKTFYEETLWERSSSEQITIINTLLNHINAAITVRSKEILIPETTNINERDPAYLILIQLHNHLITKKEGYLKLERCIDEPMVFIKDFLTEMNQTLLDKGTIKQLATSTSNVFVNMVNDLIEWISSLINSAEVKAPYRVQFFRPSQIEQKMAKAANQAHEALSKLELKWQEINSLHIEDLPTPEI